MRRNTVTIIELIIVICVIVVAVRVWTPHKKTAVHNISSPTPYSSNSCPQCGSDKLLSGSYNTEKQNSQKKLITGTMCKNCFGFSFKCPQCGSKVSALPTGSGILMPGQNINVECKKCGWYSFFLHVKM